MEDLKKEEVEAKAIRTEKRLEFADEVAKRLISEYSAEEKRQFLKDVEAVINNDFCNKLSDAEKEVALVHHNIDQFSGNSEK